MHARRPIGGELCARSRCWLRAALQLVAVLSILACSDGGSDGSSGAGRGGDRAGPRADDEVDAAVDRDADGGSDDREPPAGGGDGATDAGRDEACVPVGEREHPHDSRAAMHVSEPLPPDAYNSSPPSFGPHCHQWGVYGEFSPSAPLPACNYLHNLEHGAVVLLYNCPDGCPDIVATLRRVIDEAPNDPDCGAAKRLILTPYADMEATVAAAAWGYTWTSDCLDAAAARDLSAFIVSHWGSRGDAPEPTVCADGRITP